MRSFARLLAAIIVAFAGLGMFARQSSSAMCAHPNFPRLASELYKVRTFPKIVIGYVSGQSVPPDAHGKYSFYVDINRYYSGRGPRRIEVTNYAHYQDLPQGYEVPGNQTSRQNSGNFIVQFGGQTAILFLQADRAAGKDPTHRYASEYATSDCSYSVVGTAPATDLQRLLNDLFSKPVPPPPVEGSPSPPAISTNPPAASKPVVRASETKGTLATRAAALVLIVGASLLALAHPRSPLLRREH